MNLHEIRMAAVRAAEAAVVRDLEARGLTGAAAQPAQEPVASDDDSDALTIAYMKGFSDGKAAARASSPSPQESAAAAKNDSGVQTDGGKSHD